MSTENGNNHTQHEGAATPANTRDEIIRRAAEQHFYWFSEAAAALGRMMTLAFDISSQSTAEFAKAQARFNEARVRAKIEFEIMQRELENEKGAQ